MRGISFTEPQRQSFRAEQHRSTVVYGRVFAWVICILQSYGIYQDIAIIQLGLQTLVWRLLGLLSSLLFIVFSYTWFRRDPSRLFRLHILQLTALIVAMCGLNLLVARLPDAHPSYVYGAVGALTIAVVGVGIAAAGARRYLGAIYAVPIGLLIVGLILWTDQSAKEMALLGNAAAIGVGITVFALVHEHLARAEFNMRWLAEQRRTQVEDYAEQLEVVNRDLEHFAGVASHELQQPLVTVNWWLHLVESGLKEQGCFSGAIKERMSNAEATISHMNKLIDRLLSYTSLDGDSVCMEDVDLSEIVGEVKTPLGALLAESNAVIKVDQLPQVRGDRYLLGQLFQNLFENAVKYADPGRVPEIHVSAEAQDHQYRIAVRDNGRGIDPGGTRDIFAPRVRLDEDEKTEGTGLGLATCRKIVQLHGGTIGVTHNDCGSTFWFALPR